MVFALVLVGVLGVFWTVGEVQDHRAAQHSAAAPAAQAAAATPGETPPASGAAPR